MPTVVRTETLKGAIWGEGVGEWAVLLLLCAESCDR